MDKDEARELNREARQERYERQMNKQCKEIKRRLDFDVTDKELLEIAEMINKHDIDMDFIPLDNCNNAQDIIYEMGWLI